MKTIASVEELINTITDEIENKKGSYYFALRGATKHDIDLIAAGRDYLDCSCDDWDDRDGCEYTESKLDGTSGVRVSNDYMWDDEYYDTDKMAEAYKAAMFYAKEYNSTNTVLLIGDKCCPRSGEDSNEVVLGSNGCGADVVASVNI